MESGSAGEAYGEQVAGELARLRDALDELRRRPVALDADTLRHVITASLSEATAPPPNLLVTAIRRLDRLDARLESIEAALGAPAALPRQAASGAARGRAVTATAMPLPAPSPGADPEAIADALARRLSGMMATRSAAPMAPPAVSSQGPGATMDDLLRALRPLVPDAARSVLRRAGREPSPQAVEVLQQTALSAIEEAARSAGGQPSGFASGPWAADPRPLAPPPQVQALAPAPAPAAPPPPPIDVDELAATIADQVAAAISAQLQAAVPLDEPGARQVEPPPPPPPPAAPPLDPREVADAVISRLAQQPPPQAVVSAMAMAPLLSAVGNVEAAVARISDPGAEVVGAVDRLEAGVEALARALEDDRSQQAEEVRRGFADLHELLHTGAVPPFDLADSAVTHRAGGSGAPDGEDPEGDADQGRSAGGPGTDRLAAAVSGVQRRLDRLATQLEPLGEADIAAAVPELTLQGRRLERSLNHVLTALAALAEHLSEQSSTWRGRFDELANLVAAGAASGASGDDLGEIQARIDQLAAGLADDRQRFQRLGGTVNGLGELLGHVSARLDRMPEAAGAGSGGDEPLDDPSSGPTEAGAQVAPTVPWYEEEPDEPETRAGGGSSVWDTPDDEWKRMDLWGGARDDRGPEPDEANGDGAAHADGEADEASEAGDAAAAPAGDAGEDRTGVGPSTPEGDAGRRRRGRSRRGNRRG